MTRRLRPAVLAVLLATLVATPATAGATPAMAAPATTWDLPALRAAARAALRQPSAGRTAAAGLAVAPLVSATSSGASATSSDTAAPGDVVVAGAIGRAYVSWQPPASATEPITGYRLYRGTTATSLALAGTTAGTATLVRGLAINATYYFAVAAVTASGEGTRSAAVPVKIPVAEVVAARGHASGSDLVAFAGPHAPVVPVVADGHTNIDPAISPDGKWLAYASDASGRFGIYVRPADGSGPVRATFLPSEGTAYSQPSWSPDGRYVVATTEDSDEIYTALFDVVARTESGVSPELRFGASFTAGASVVEVDANTGVLREEGTGYVVRRAIRGTASVLDADVSPDGQWIAFAKVVGTAGETPLTNVHLISLQGGQSRVIAAPGGLNTDIAWSRLGTSVTFAHAVIDNVGNAQPPSVMAVRTDGTGVHVEQNSGFAPASRRLYAPPRAVAPRPPYTIPDFDGDGGHELGVFRPSNGTWYVRGKWTVQYGTAGDVPVPVDFNGDGKDEIAVYRPSTGTWYVRGLGSVRYGAPGDVPVPADYDGDGKADIAVYRPSTGAWHIRGIGKIAYGRAGDIPVPGDYTGLGVSVAVWRPSNGTWYVRSKGRNPDVQIQYGRAGDIPIAVESMYGDHWLGIYRTSTAQFFMRTPGGGLAQVQRFDAPVQAYGSVVLGMMLSRDGVGIATMFQPATGGWSGPPGHGENPVYGQKGDLPL